MSLDQTAKIVKSQTPTHDAFLGGRLTIAQPRTGFRAGLDSVLLGAAVRTETGRLLDLGAGVGTAALVALTHHPAVAATLAELDAETLALALENVAANGFAERAEILALDVTAPGRARAAAGLVSDHYAVVIANPPFFATGQGTPAREAGRAAARQMAEGSLELWAKTAAASAAPDAEILFILPAELLGAALAAFEPRFGAIAVLPFAPRPGADAGRILVRGIKGSRAPLNLGATRPLHGEDGKTFAPEIEAVLRGTAPLLW